MPHSNSCLKAAALAWLAALSEESASKQELVMPTICRQECDASECWQYTLNRLAACSVRTVSWHNVHKSVFGVHVHCLQGSTAQQAIWFM